AFGHRRIAAREPGGGAGEADGSGVSRVGRLAAVSVVCPPELFAQEVPADAPVRGLVEPDLEHRAIAIDSAVGGVASVFDLAFTLVTPDKSLRGIHRRRAGIDAEHH